MSSVNNYDFVYELTRDKDNCLHWLRHRGLLGSFEGMIMIMNDNEFISKLHVYTNILQNFDVQ